MNLRWKILGIILLTFAGLVAILTFSLQGILVPHFREEETRAAETNIQRVLGIIESERSSLTGSIAVWASDDENYALLTSQGDEAFHPNPSAAVLTSLNIDALALVTLQGDITSAYPTGSPASAQTVIPAEVMNHLHTGDAMLRSAGDSEPVSGLLHTDRGPVLLVSSPVLDGSGSGPAAGTLLALRYLDAAELNQIAAVMRFPLTLKSYSQPNLPQDFQEAKDGFSAGETIVNIPSSDILLASYVVLPDFYGEPGFILRVEQGRTIYRNSQIVLLYLYIAMIMGALLFSIMTFLTFDRLVLSRIRQLENEVTRIGTGGDLSARVTVVHSDELTRVSRAINQMLGSLQALSNRLVDIQESERRKIALELHDEIGQLLTGLKLQLDTALNDGTVVSETSLVRARELTEELIIKTRNLSLDLRPTMLDDLGLLPALLWHFDRYTALTGVKVDFSQNGINDRRFSPELESTVYRLIQEALTNTARHSGVQQVSVHATCLDETLTIQVEDRGSGFLVERELESGRTRGLHGMQERVALLGGSLTIDSVPGWGTSILVDLPVEPQPAERRDDDHHIAGR